MSCQELWVRVYTTRRPKRIKAQLRTLAILTIKFSAHDDHSLGYPVSKALGGRLMIAVVVVLRSSRED